MTAGKGKSFSPEENERIRAAARKLLAEHGGNQTALGKTVGVRQSTISDFVRAVAPTGAGVQLAQGVADALGVSLDALRTGQVHSDAESFPLFRNLPGWREAEAKARRTYGRRLPAAAWEAAGQLMGAQAPAVVNELTVFNLVSSLWEMMSDETRAEAIRRQAETEMDHEDAAADVLLKSREVARIAGRPLPPLPDDPTVAVKKRPTGPVRAASPAVARKRAGGKGN